MPDMLDNAAQLESRQRQQALLHTRQQFSREPPQITDAGQVVCIDCELPVQPARLQAKPDAARCIDCQELWEYDNAR